LTTDSYPKHIVETKHLAKQRLLDLIGGIIICQGTATRLYNRNNHHRSSARPFEELYELIGIIMPLHQNPILPGFNPDPSIVRVKDDFFLVTSTVCHPAFPPLSTFIDG